MPVPRVTMRDVAEAAGVHQTTVSLALRNDPRLPPHTRQRVRAVARRLGYRPDPVLSALNFYRLARHAVKAPPTMAFIYNFTDERAMLAASHAHRLFLEGARKQAGQLGYHLDIFYVGPHGGAAGKTDRILRARNISGVILAAFGDQAPAFRLDWPRYSTVLIESRQLGLRQHTISSHQQNITREAVRRARALGYRRIGVAVGAREEDYLQNAFTAGYYVECSLWPELVALPPLIMPLATNEELATRLAPWLETHGIEVVLSNWNSVPTALRVAGRKVPRDVAFASLDLPPEARGTAGMRQNHRLVGARAVELLAGLMHTHSRGLVDVPNLTLIDGAWSAGASLPARRVSVQQ